MSLCGGSERIKQQSPVEADLLQHDLNQTDPQPRPSIDCLSSLLVLLPEDTRKDLWSFINSTDQG